MFSKVCDAVRQEAPAAAPEVVQITLDDDDRNLSGGSDIQVLSKQNERQNPRSKRLKFSDPSNIKPIISRVEDSEDIQILSDNSNLPRVNNFRRNGKKVFPTNKLKTEVMEIEVLDIDDDDIVPVNNGSSIKCNNVLLPVTNLDTDCLESRHKPNIPSAIEVQNSFISNINNQTNNNLSAPPIKNNHSSVPPPLPYHLDSAAPEANNIESVPLEANDLQSLSTPESERMENGIIHQNNKDAIPKPHSIESVNNESSKSKLETYNGKIPQTATLHVIGNFLENKYKCSEIFSTNPSNDLKVLEVSEDIECHMRELLKSEIGLYWSSVRTSSVMGIDVSKINSLSVLGAVSESSSKQCTHTNVSASGNCVNCLVRVDDTNKKGAAEQGRGVLADQNDIEVVLNSLLWLKLCISNIHSPDADLVGDMFARYVLKVSC